MKCAGILMLGLLYTASIFSQKSNFRIDQNISEYYVDTLYSQIDFIVSNNADSALVLWISKDSHDSLQNSKKIKNYFFNRKGDWTLMGIIWDGNVSVQVPALFKTFFKVIRPKEQFTISILKKGKVGHNLFNSISRHIIIVKASEIRGFSLDSITEMFNYKPNIISINFDFLNI